jgi:hypothetical protein
MNFYCRFYCLLNMFRAPLCPSSGAREYYTSGCCTRCCSNPQTGHTTLSSTLYRQLENQAPNKTGRNHLYNTLELLMMGIMVPKTRWASNKICNKNSSVASSWHFISTYYRRCTVKATSLQRSILRIFRTSHKTSYPVYKSARQPCCYYLL